MKKSRIEQLAQEAIDLNKQLMPILAELIELVHRHDLVEMRRQLRAVEQSVHQLESAGVPVPEELLSRQREQNQTLNNFKQVENAISKIQNSFSPLLKIQKKRPKPSKSSGGKRVVHKCRIEDLVSEGFLEDGMKIVHENTHSKETITGYIREPGYIEVELDGQVERFDTPSGAGARVLGRPVNGWDFWSVCTNNYKKIVLDKYRRKFLRHKKNQ